MDLPTCPACGQSVLDDDATDCPFCGAAMDGSSPAKTPTGSAATKTSAEKKKPEKESAPDDEDPFAIKQAPTAKKVLPCARKPMKGRLHRVVCPMCDTQGFIPKRAVGRQVKCANPECLVPVFTAGGEESDNKPKAPARVSDAEDAKDNGASSEKAGKKNSMMIYGIVGAVLLAATLGLVAVLNQPAVDVIPAGPLPEFTNIDDDPEDDIPVKPVPNDPKVANGTDYQAEAIEIVGDMIDASLQSSGNRDKSFCRRMTADAYLRLGLDEKAAAEFRQMQVVAGQDGVDRDYFKIGPLLTRHWTKIAVGDQAAATASLNEAKALVDEIPDSRGDVALGTSISLAAALANAGEVETATAMVTELQGDVSVDEQQDSVRYAAWASSAQTLRDAGRTALPPMNVFAWHRPLVTVVGLQLAVQHRWQAATNWAKAQTDPQTASDTFAVIASEMAPASTEQQLALAAAAKSKGPEIALRTFSNLASADSQWLPKASAEFAALPQAKATSLGKFSSIIDVESPDLSKSTLAGNAITGYIIAASAAQNDAAVAEGFDRLYHTMVSAVPPSAEIRKAAGAVGRSETQVKKQLAAELQLSDDRDVRTNFNSYRRGIDRLARAAESRRLSLIQMLSRIVSSNAATGLNAVLTQPDSLLRAEVMVDQLSGLLYVAAAGTNQDLVYAAQRDADSAVAIARVDAVPEASVVGGLVEACRLLSEDQLAAAFAKIEQSPGTTGLRAATMNYLVESEALKADSVATVMKAVTKLQQLVWQEEALDVIARTSVRRGELKAAKTAIDTTSLKPGAQVAFLYGLVCGAVEKLKAQE